MPNNTIDLVWILIAVFMVGGVILHLHRRFRKGQNNQTVQVIRAHPIVTMHTDDPLHYQISRFFDVGRWCGAGAICVYTVYS